MCPPDRRPRRDGVGNGVCHAESGGRLPGGHIGPPLQDGAWHSNRTSVNPVKSPGEYVDRLAPYPASTSITTPSTIQKTITRAKTTYCRFESSRSPLTSAERARQRPASPPWRRCSSMCNIPTFPSNSLSVMLTRWQVSAMGLTGHECAMPKERQAFPEGSRDERVPARATLGRNILSRGGRPDPCRPLSRPHLFRRPDRFWLRRARVRHRSFDGPRMGAASPDFSGRRGCGPAWPGNPRATAPGVAVGGRRNLDPFLRR